MAADTGALTFVADPAGPAATLLPVDAGAAGDSLVVDVADASAELSLLEHPATPTTTAAPAAPARNLLRVGASAGRAASSTGANGFDGDFHILGS